MLSLMVFFYFIHSCVQLDCIRRSSTFLCIFGCFCVGRLWIRVGWKEMICNVGREWRTEVIKSHIQNDSIASLYILLSIPRDFSLRVFFFCYSSIDYYYCSIFMYVFHEIASSHSWLFNCIFEARIKHK